MFADQVFWLDWLFPDVEVRPRVRLLSRAFLAAEKHADLTFFVLELCHFLLPGLFLLFESSFSGFKLTDLFFSQTQQVLVPVQLQFHFCFLSLTVIRVLLYLLFLFIKFVLDALYVKFQLLFDFDVVTDLCFVFLEHLIVVVDPVSLASLRAAL